MTRTITRLIPTESDMLACGSMLAMVVGEGAVVFLYGKLGAGKTTLVRGVLRGMDYQGKVKSPTYTIVEPYEQAGKCIYHFDLFRLNQPEELEQIGFADYVGTSSVCLIEWPEKGLPLLPEPDLACYIEMVDQGRELRIESHTARGERMLACLQQTLT